MTVNADGFDEELARQIVIMLSERGLRTDVLEAGAIPWPNFGPVLCINFVPVVQGVFSREAVSPFVTSVLNYVLSKRLFTRYSAIQIGISVRISAGDQPSFKRFARFFVDTNRLDVLPNGAGSLQESGLNEIGKWT